MEGRGLSNVSNCRFVLLHQEAAFITMMDKDCIVRLDLFSEEMDVVGGTECDEIDKQVVVV